MPTFSIVSGNGFTGNAQRMELPSSSGLVGFAQIVNYDYSLRLGLFKIDQYGAIDNSFNTGIGFIKNDINKPIINSFIIDSNGKYLVGGNFSLYNGVSANNIIRLNSDGSKDTSFVYDSGFNDIIMSVIEDSSNKYVVCGSYNLYGATSSNSIIRLNSNGSIDTTFNIGSGFNVSSYNHVYSIIQDSNSKYLVGGYFTGYNGTSSNYIIRLNNNGTIDTSFNIGSGFDGYTYCLLQDSNSKYVIAGGFTQYNGTSSNYIIRLNNNGTIDTSFNIGSGFSWSVFKNDYTINSLIQDSNGKYLIGGRFISYNGVGANHIIRLNYDGSIDTGFVYGDGFNDSVMSIMQDSNGKYVIGGYFTEYNGVSAYNIIRLNLDGSIDNTFYNNYLTPNGNLTCIKQLSTSYIISGNLIYSMDNKKHPYDISWSLSFEHRSSNGVRVYDHGFTNLASNLSNALTYQSEVSKDDWSVNYANYDLCWSRRIVFMPGTSSNTAWIEIDNVNLAGRELTLGTSVTTTTSWNTVNYWNTTLSTTTTWNTSKSTTTAWNTNTSQSTTTTWNTSKSTTTTWNTNTNQSTTTTWNTSKSTTTTWNTSQSTSLLTSLSTTTTWLTISNTITVWSTTTTWNTTRLTDFYIH